MHNASDDMKGSAPSGNKMAYERIGIVIDSIPRGDVACIVFSHVNEPLYLVPRQVLLSHDVHHQLPYLSNSQRARLYKTFAVGDNVEFNISSVGLVNAIEKTYKFKDLHLSHDGKNVLDVIGLVSDDKTPRFYTFCYGYLNADPKLLKSVHPNVAFKCAIQMDLDYGAHTGLCEFPLKTFKPKLICSLHSFSSVELGFEYVVNAPWNVKLAANLKWNRCMEWKDEFVGYVTDQITECGSGRKTHRNVSCIAISENEVFSPIYSRRIMIARRKFEENDFVPGMNMIVDLYYCPINRCHIVFDYTIGETAIPTRHFKGVYQFLISIYSLNCEEGFFSEKFGHIADPEGWFPYNAQINRQNSVKAWVEHNPDYKQSVERFLIFSVPDDDELPEEVEKPVQELKHPEVPTNNVKEVLQVRAENHQNFGRESAKNHQDLSNDIQKIRQDTNSQSPAISNNALVQKLDSRKCSENEDSISTNSSITPNSLQLSEDSIENIKYIITTLAADPTNHEALKRNGLYGPIMNAYNTILEA